MGQKNKKVEKIYISGCISLGGTLQPREVFMNMEVFRHYKHILTELGFEVVSPIDLAHRHGGTWTDYMLECIRNLFPCDSIFMLSGWEKSRGAKIERAIALADGKNVYNDEWLNKLRLKHYKENRNEVT